MDGHMQGPSRCDDAFEDDGASSDAGPTSWAPSPQVTPPQPIPAELKNERVGPVGRQGCVCTRGGCHRGARRHQGKAAEEQGSRRNNSGLDWAVHDFSWGRGPIQCRMRARSERCVGATPR